MKPGVHVRVLVTMFVLAPGAADAADASAFSPPFLRLAFGLALCSVLALVAAIAIRRFMHKGFAWRWPKAQKSGVSVLESRRISPHADVCRIASTDAEYLVVVSSGAATVLESKPRSPSSKGDTP